VYTLTSKTGGEGEVAHETKLDTRVCMARRNGNQKRSNNISYCLDSHGKPRTDFSQRFCTRTAMMKLTLPIALLLGQLASPSLAQQIPSALFSLDLLGLSDGCMDVVNKTITSCPGWLPQHVGFGYIMTA
jgi:hypothetical protein